MREFHLFAGIGGGIYGGQLLNNHCVGGVEINPYCRTVLRQRQADGWMEEFPISEDIRELHGVDIAGTFDILCGGFPCQAFSHAARGNNIAEKNLWPEMFRVVQESHAPIVFAENVTREAIETAANDLVGLGYAVKYCKLSCEQLGADHSRARYWLMAVINNLVFEQMMQELIQLPPLAANCWLINPHEIEYPTVIESRAPQFLGVGNAQSPFAAATAFRILANRHANNAVNNVNVRAEELDAVFVRQLTWIKQNYGENYLVHTPTTMYNFHYPSMQKHPVCRHFVEVFGRAYPENFEYLMGFPIGASSPNPLPIENIEVWNQ